MNIRNTFIAAVAGIALVSCNQNDGWTDADREEFVGGCSSSYVESFKNSMGSNMEMVDEDKLVKMAEDYCSCSYEAIKKNYASADEAFEHSTDELMEDAKDCEPSDDEISDLIIE